MKPTNSHQVENTNTKEISQRVESDTAVRSSDSSVSFDVPAKVTLHGTQLADEAIKDTEEAEENQGHDQVQNSIATHKPKRTTHRPTRFDDMVVAYALPVELIEDSVPSTYREAELKFESERWREAMGGEMHSHHKNITWELAKLPKEKKAIGCK